MKNIEIRLNFYKKIRTPEPEFLIDSRELWIQIGILETGYSTEDALGVQIVITDAPLHENLPTNIWNFNLPWHSPNVYQSRDLG